MKKLLLCAFISIFIYGIFATTKQVDTDEQEDETLLVEQPRENKKKAVEVQDKERRRKTPIDNPKFQKIKTKKVEKALPVNKEKQQENIRRKSQEEDEVERVYNKFKTGTQGQLISGFNEFLSNDKIKYNSKSSTIKDLKGDGIYHMFFYQPEGIESDTFHGVTKYIIELRRDYNAELRIVGIKTFAPPEVEFEVSERWPSYKESKKKLYLPTAPFIQRINSNIEYVFSKDQILASKHRGIANKYICKRLILVNHDEIYKKSESLAIYCDSLKGVQFKVGMAKIKFWRD